ncbi:hypothetical protein CR513_36186, partial [Mucuna pruriens]
MPHSEEKWQSLEERLQAVEGGDKYGLETADLRLILDVGLPTDFKTPEFDKYKRSSYPRVHLAILERGRIKRWRDLAEAFLKQYKYNEDMAQIAPNVESLLALEHAQEGAGRLQRVRPEMARAGGASLTTNNRKGDGNVTSNFTDLVVVGERIKLGIRRGKFAQASSNVGFTKKPASEKKKGEANAVLVEPIFPQGKGNTPSYPTQTHVGSRPSRADTGAATSSRPAQQGTRRPPKMLAPIHMAYIELLPLLLEQKLVEIILLKPLEPPYPKSYDPNARSDYHGGAVGHATKRCWSLKHKVQYLLDGGLLSFQDQGSNVQNNPLPAHGGVTINAISHENRDEAEEASRRERKESMVGYTTDSVNQMEEGAHFSRLNEAESALVTYIEGNGKPHPKSLIIHYNSASQPIVSFIIQVPTRLIYNNNAIPWRYPVGETITPPTIKEDPVPEVTNIAGTGGVI